MEVEVPGNTWFALEFLQYWFGGGSATLLLLSFVSSWTGPRRDH